MNKIYTGIGSRNCPQEILNQIRGIASMLAEKGWLLRSGGADGADSAFEEGAKKYNHLNIFLPWKNFNDNNSTLFYISEKALKMAEQFHPGWKYLSRGARLLHARNCYQVLGTELDSPSDVIICYTKDGAGKGGTGQALRIAKSYNIPIIDLGKKTEKSEKLLKKILFEIS